MAGNAVVGRRRLASGLRRHRTEAGWTIEDLARGLECSPAKVSRMETGVVGIRLQDLHAIADLLGLDGDERSRMTVLVREARSRGWWREFSDVVPPGAATFYGLEDGASVIAHHSTSLVPGLLQTRRYASALFASVADGDTDLAERRIALRMRRQLILQRASPPVLRMMLDEAVLHRPIGGVEVMGEQVDHLLSLMSGPGIDVRIIPFVAGVHEAVGVSFSMFEFDDPSVTPVVFTEQLTRNGFVDEPDEIGVYRDAWDGLDAVALDRAESREFVAGRRAAFR